MPSFGVVDEVRAPVAARRLGRRLSGHGVGLAVVGERLGRIVGGLPAAVDDRPGPGGIAAARACRSSGTDPAPGTTAAPTTIAPSPTAARHTFIVPKVRVEQRRRHLGSGCGVGITRVAGRIAVGAASRAPIVRGAVRAASPEAASPVAASPSASGRVRTRRRPSVAPSVRARRRVAVAGGGVASAPPSPRQPDAGSGRTNSVIGSDASPPGVPGEGERAVAEDAGVARRAPPRARSPDRRRRERSTRA